MPVERHGYMTNLLGDRAVQTIEGYAKSKEPFLLSLHFTAPHWPWEGPDDEAESKRIRNIFHRDGGTQKTYAAMVQSLDANIGRVLQALDAHGLAGNTIVVFTSDNGGERFSNTWPFTGMKGELLEGGLRIPAIVRWPGRIAAGSVSEQVMISMDWLPTLLAAAGTAAGPGLSARRREPAADPDRPRGAASAQAVLALQGRRQRAVRDGDWKYLRIAGNEFLFDVVKDPRERANLKDRHKDVFDRLKSDWEAWNNTMLPERPRPAAYSNPGNFLADHYGVTNPAPSNWSCPPVTWFGWCCLGGITLTFKTAWAMHMDTLGATLFLGTDAGLKVTPAGSGPWSGVWDGGVGSVTLYHDILGYHTESPIPVRSHNVRIFYEKVRDFVTAVREGRPAPIPAEQIVRNQAVIDAVLRSAAEQREVAVEIPPL